MAVMQLFVMSVTIVCSLILAEAIFFWKSPFCFPIFRIQTGRCGGVEVVGVEQRVSEGGRKRERAREVSESAI